MASYLELYGLMHDQELIARLTMACADAAENIRGEPTDTPDHAKRIVWAQRTLQNVDGMARSILLLALVQNTSLTVAQIQGASDAALLTAVNNAITLLI